MRKAIVAQLAEGGIDLDPLVREAVERLGRAAHQLDIAYDNKQKDVIGGDDVRSTSMNPRPAGREHL